MMKTQSKMYVGSCYSYSGIIKPYLLETFQQFWYSLQYFYSCPYKTEQQFLHQRPQMLPAEYVPIQRILSYCFPNQFLTHIFQL